MYLKRTIDQELYNWVKDTYRKPIMLRGARQVGKSTAVRNLARQFDYFIEINFEEQKQVHRIFEGDLSPHELCDNLSLLTNIPIIPGKTLLFFDEIQACLPAISSLRFFYEKFPELHVLAGGSLLEFALDELPSFGVGRVRSMFVYPLSFDEFLIACGEEKLLQARRQASPENPLHNVIHLRLIDLLKRFLVLGGMPEVISHYVEGKKIQQCQMVIDDLMISLKADFGKYKKRVPFSRINEVFEAIVKQTGGKFVYSKATRDANHKQIKEAVDLLIKTGLVIPVTHTSANGLPLGAESDPKKRKLLIFDTGILQRILNLNLAEVLLNSSFESVNKGDIAELYVGLEILKSGSCYQENPLYYWQREALNSNAEVDYILHLKNNIIPAEVKSGLKGSMQSIFLFLNEKKCDSGVRFSLENYSTYKNIKVYPLYAVSDFLK